ncbi:MAG: retroviral-like aspartic protease family protein [Chthoniobacterales bacterium]|nr:retroviral-like aspartic protease family protein [Chthoniobacterales bacterium]
MASLLIQTDYQQVHLSRSGVGHFHATGSLNGRSVVVLIDTGAASTVVSLVLVRQMGLSFNKLKMKGGGAGGANLDIYQLTDAVLMLGEIKPRPRALLAMDLTHVNQALAQKGESAVDVILGSDVLEAQAAVIDYGSSSLFLKRQLDLVSPPA